MAVRQCGGCTLCCKLLPVHGDLRVNGVDLPGNFYKPAGHRCPHQRHGKGCRVYNQPAMPSSCRLWSCRWLVDPETADLRRPDHSRYVLDLSPDVVNTHDPDTGERHEIEVVQVWVDPADRNAWRDPALLAYLARLGERGIAALIRYSAHDGFALFPPAMMKSREWAEIHHGQVTRERPIDEQIRAINRARS